MVQDSLRFPLLRTVTRSSQRHHYQANIQLTTPRKYDFLNRLLSVSSTPTGSGQAAIGYGYQYNDANQRIVMTLADGSYWLYRYDGLGQVVSGKRYWLNETAVPGRQKMATKRNWPNTKTTDQFRNLTRL